MGGWLLPGSTEGVARDALMAIEAGLRRGGLVSHLPPAPPNEPSRPTPTLTYSLLSNIVYA